MVPERRRQQCKDSYWTGVGRGSIILPVVVVLTLTRMIKSVVTGQAPVTLGLRNTPGKKNKPKVVHAYVTATAIHASTRNM